MGGGIKSRYLESYEALVIFLPFPFLPPLSISNRPARCRRNYHCVAVSGLWNQVIQPDFLASEYLTPDLCEGFLPGLCGVVAHFLLLLNSGVR